jgi:hypothetical protein
MNPEGCLKTCTQKAVPLACFRAASLLEGSHYHFPKSIHDRTTSQAKDRQPIQTIYPPFHNTPIMHLLEHHRKLIDAIVRPLASSSDERWQPAEVARTLRDIDAFWPEADRESSDMERLWQERI